MLNKILEKFKNKLSPNRTFTSLSDDQIYQQVCIQAVNDCKAFNEFRRNPTYNLVLEHVSEELGLEYLREIENDHEIYDKLDSLKANDQYGGPLLYNYPGIGTFSPTTLRYVKVLTDLKKHFQTLDNLNICEIGVGYGGQCRAINVYYHPASYCLIDIKPALNLTQRYLDHFILHSIVEYKTMNELCQKEYDLLISNYAFTELRREIQDVYLTKIILNSKRGYIIYNEITPPEFNSYKADELIKKINGARIVEEKPLTHPKNCIILWD